MGESIIIFLLLLVAFLGTILLALMTKLVRQSHAADVQQLQQLQQLSLSEKNTPSSDGVLFLLMDVIFLFFRFWICLPAIFTNLFLTVIFLCEYYKKVQIIGILRLIL